MANSPRFTPQQLAQLVESGRIKAYNLPQPQVIDTCGTTVKGVLMVPKEPKKLLSTKADGKEYIQIMLPWWAEQKGVSWVTEHRFKPPRRWRFDWAIPILKIAIEYEGLSGGENGAHRNTGMYLKDMEKYNAATCLGWRLLRYGFAGYKKLIPDLDELYLLHQKQMNR